MIQKIYQIFTFGLLFPSIVLLGIYLTIRLRFLQISKLKIGFKQIFIKNKKAEGSISHFQAVVSVLAGNFGTGNISGMAVALSAGGPGALVWMWVMAFFGSIIQYASCLLAVKYREQNEKGEYVGGPMYYLSRGLGLRGIGILFALMVIFGAVSVGIFCQINSISLSLAQSGISPLITGVGVAFLVAIVMLGGMKRMAQVASMVIPFMAVLYLGSALVILALYAHEIGNSFKLMFQSALGFSAISGGAIGYAMMKVITTGLGRALFATDVGTGYVPILQAGARSRHHVIDGAVALVAPLMVMIVCTITALVLIVTGAYQSGLQSTTMVVHAFQLGVGKIIGTWIVNIALFLFGYTTILAWGCCFDRAIGYIFGSRLVSYCRLLFIALIPVGAFFQVEFVWLFADISLVIMTFLNLIGIFGLSREVISESRDYFLPTNATY
ncbi:MAG: alanine/glycine:cation symporter family protein [Chlamydiales bacterium]